MELCSHSWDNINDVLHSTSTYQFKWELGTRLASITLVPISLIPFSLTSDQIMRKTDMYKQGLQFLTMVGTAAITSTTEHAVELFDNEAVVL